MIAVENMHSPMPDRPAPPDRATADEETLQALELMLANPDDRLPDAERTSNGHPLDRCGLVREMLARLDTLTAAGQRDVMGRVIALLATEQGEARGLGHGNRRTFCEQLERLRHEADRLWPDAASFCKRAENLISMIDPTLAR